MKLPVCPTHNLQHQPAYDPWYTGDSLYAREYALKGPLSNHYYHYSHTPFEVGDILLPPADLRILPVDKPFIKVLDDGCISYSYYDVHAVYLTTELWEDDSWYEYVYEVEPIGRVWMDPEKANLIMSKQVGVTAYQETISCWCTDKAKVIRIL